MIKVVAIMGSPHKGNSLEATQRFETSLHKLGEVEFEYLHLKDLDLQPCKGCFVCFVKGEDRCPLKDDMALIRTPVWIGLDINIIISSRQGSELFFSHRVIGKDAVCREKNLGKTVIIGEQGQ